jgi:hypothetical protein
MRVIGCGRRLLYGSCVFIDSVLPNRRRKILSPERFNPNLLPHVPPSGIGLAPPEASSTVRTPIFERFESRRQALFD